MLLSKYFFTIPVRQRILYYSSLSEDFFTIPVRQQSLYYPFLKGFLYYSCLKGFLYCSSLKGFLYYSSPTEDSLLIGENDKQSFPHLRKR